MHRIWNTILVLGVGCLIQACGPLAAPPAAAVNVSTIVAATLQAMTPAVPPSPAAAAGLAIAYDNLSFVIPSGLASGTTNNTTTDVEFPYVNPSNGLMPQHTKITLNGYPLQGTLFKPEITVYRAAEYVQYGPLTQNIVSALQGLKYAAGQPLPKGLPDGVIVAKTQEVDFADGRGLRFLTQFDQAPLPVNNQELFYYFLGLTTDGSQFLQVILPVQAPFLSPDDNPASALPAGGVAFEMNELQIYFDTVTEKLNATTSEQFTPSLATLDALVQSISAK